MTDEVTHPNLQRLKDFMMKTLTTDEWAPDEINVHLFRDKDGGIRIAELGYIKRNDKGIFGGDWMSSDADSGKVIFAAERFLLFVDVPVLDVETWETDLDEGQEHERLLCYAMTGRWPEWEDRPATHRYVGPNNYIPIKETT